MAQGEGLQPMVAAAPMPCQCCPEGGYFALLPSTQIAPGRLILSATVSSTRR
jgi:hypothetical protein